MSNYKIDDNGFVRDMTPEEVAAFLAEQATYAKILATEQE